MKFAIIGFGGRGGTYAHFIKYYGEEVVAICDPDEKKRPLAAEYGVTGKSFYTDEDEFFAAGKIADVLVVSTLDTLHYRQTMRALDLGYDVLLEKPIACTLQECRDIEKKAKQTGRKVVVCHVLRYAPMYMKLKELLDKHICGDVVSIYMSEDIGFYHFAHSFVRGNWRNEKVSDPLILAKNCHHLDLFCWLLGKKFKSVTSAGSLKYFNKEHAPEGAADHCVDCKYRGTCVYDAFAIYNNKRFEALAGLAAHGRLGSTEEEINASLSDRSNPYSRCVFRCDNDLCDNQVVQIAFEDGITAQLSSSAFSYNMGGSFRILCTEGVIEKYGKNIRCETFDGKEQIFEIVIPKGGYAHHGGGDVGIIKHLIDYVKTGEKSVFITDISTSVMSHEIGFAAEISRKNNNRTVYADE